jgi:hypothetical protein
MWILPTNLPVNSPISASALVTEELISDFTESLDKNYEPSLLARSKPSRWKTFLQKWKQGCYLRLRCGLIYAHSLGLTSKGLTYSAGVFHVSPSRQRESETPIAILDTSSQQSLKESDTQSLDLFSWKTSKESCLPNSQETIGATQQELQFCSMSSENWSEWVTKQRQEYSARVKSAHPTRGNECLSWPTVTANEDSYRIGGESQQSKCLSAMARRGELHGQAAPANPSTLGSRQGWWTPQVQDSKHSGTNPSANGKRDLLVNQVGAVQKQWATPNNFCFQPPENTEQWTKRAEYQQTEKGVNLHKPIQSQVLHENEKVMGAMPPSAAKLNPRWVETLMGLPVGWTMPSCAYPVTIAPTNCASSATESCQQQQSELL